MERAIDLIAPDAFPYTTPTGVTYDSGQYAQRLERVLELADYEHWHEQARQQRGVHAPLLGIGLATVVKASGAYGDYRVESAQVRIAPSGYVTASTGVSRHGQDSDTTFAQIVADALGVSTSEVQVRHGDTALLPAGGGTGASRGLTVGGSALYTVVQQARQKLVRIAAHLLQCPVEAVVLQDGRVFTSTRRSLPKRSGGLYIAEQWVRPCLF
jgi:carbon-monoxide dehydrogenase large subunit